MRRAFRVAALFLSLLIAVLAVEIALRAMGMGFGNSPMESDPHLHHVHPRNYTFVQQHPSGELGGFKIEYNAEGRVFRGGDPAENASQTESKPCRVALMGDSFTEGGQVPFAASFAGKLEEAARGACEVRNYGVRSYSPAIYLVQWTREVRNWKPAHVFLLLYGNDVREDANYLTTADKDEKGMPTAIRGPSSDWFFSQLRQLYVARFVRMVWMRGSWAWEHRGEDQMRIGGVVEENPELSPLTADLVLELNRRVAADGAQLILMVVPSRYRLMGDGSVKVEHDFYAAMQQWALANGVRFLDLFEPFERASPNAPPLFFRQDIHFTEEGHALTAAAIARAYPQLFPAWQQIRAKSVQAAFEGQPTDK
jgi:lysophospholipase L1-like esterase